MLENRRRREVVSRGGRKELDDEDQYDAFNDGSLQQRGIGLRRWIIGIIVCLSVTLLGVNTFTADQLGIKRHFRRLPLDNDIISTTMQPPSHDSGYLVRTKGCRIPALDPFDPAIKRYVFKEKPILCEAGNYPPLIGSNHTALYVDPKARGHFYNDSEPVDCCWRNLSRSENQDNAVTYGRECHRFNDSTTVNAEFVKVECTVYGDEDESKIYRDYHAFVPRKPKVEKRCKQAVRPDPSTPPLSVLVLGLDAVSRLNFHRTMPKTAKALRMLEAVEMLGYNKVGDNTFPNLIPVLAGLSEEELRTRCWLTNKANFDRCPFIWNNFSAAGYRTVFGEDACGITIFNYMRAGFRSPPTDYYLRPFCIAAENDIGNTHKLNADLCVGTRKNFDTLLEYTKKFTREFSGDPYFAFFWQSSLTHDFLNYPQLGDHQYSRFVEYMENSGLLNNTALILMSDHGIRWGGIRQTYQGRVEESLPFVFVVLPTWWRKRFPTAWANLRRNARSLTTPFDLHETLNDLLMTEGLFEHTLRNRTRTLSSGIVPRGMSFFLPIPDHRTCSTAKIPGHFCMCHNSQNISLENAVVEQAVRYVLKEINAMLKRYPQCARLKLKNLTDAKMWAEKTKPKTKEAPMVDYTVTITTTPGDAVFEASVRHRTNDSTTRLVGPISRLNLYGKQSACVDESRLRLYCYCS